MTEHIPGSAEIDDDQWYLGEEPPDYEDWPEPETFQDAVTMRGGDW